jgi:hypothetical protein
MKAGEPISVNKSLLKTESFERPNTTKDVISMFKTAFSRKSRCLTLCKIKWSEKLKLLQIEIMSLEKRIKRPKSSDKP